MVFGVDVVTVTPTDFLRAPLLWFELVTRYGGTHTAAPNFAYALAARALQRAEGLDLSTLRFALNGAEPIDVTAVQAFLAAGERFGLPATAMVPAYGMAETTLGVSIQHTGRPFTVDVLDAVALEEERVARPPSTPDAASRAFPRLGEPLADIEVQVRDDAGAVLADGGVGTLFIRGPAVTDRYLTVDGDVATQGADGWLDTGDVGYLVDGEVVVCGRVKDVIIMGGRNIYPTDIERVATSVEGVRAGNAIAVRWTASGGRESFVVACESRQADDPEQAARIVAAGALGGDRRDRGAPGAGAGAAGRLDPEDAVRETQAVGGSGAAGAAFGRLTRCARARPAPEAASVLTPRHPSSVGGIRCRRCPGPAMDAELRKRMRRHARPRRGAAPSPRHAPEIVAECARPAGQKLPKLGRKVLSASGSGRRRGRAGAGPRRRRRRVRAPAGAPCARRRRSP